MLLPDEEISKLFFGDEYRDGYVVPWYLLDHFKAQNKAQLKEVVEWLYTYWNDEDAFILPRRAVEALLDEVKDAV